MKTLIKNGTVVTATDQWRGDILIEDERIALLGSALQAVSIGEVDKTIDASGKLVLPGGIDVHTHLDMPFGGTTSADDFQSGTIAAAHGGTTCIVDFAIQYHGQGDGRDRLRLPHDHDRAERSSGTGDGCAGPRGGHVVQALHGLSRRLHAR
jgi:hypothetical protein